MHKVNNTEAFKQLQKDMGATNSALSSLLGVSVATIEKRRAGKVSIANEVIIAMKYLRLQ
ncbi:hypothetical protein NVP1213O_73, partial [Vibrio phage 1.213.O._10N.222.54.F10]